ncbi:MAG TPA: conjugative transposon protein TraM, partial [Pricia sp.]|nr:conjugative transposon protein TraM [Pricia sp.]
MNGNIEKLNIWIRRHKLFAFSAPIIASLAVFFVVTSIRSMEDGNRPSTKEGAYNNTLPGQKKELIVTEPHDIYKKSQRDSLAALNQKGLFKSILDTKRENDSLERMLEELDNFSFEEREDEANSNMEYKQNSKPRGTEYASKKTAAREKLEYRNLLMQARSERLSQSQDYSAPYSETSPESSAAPIWIEAAIYRDQFVLPGDRVTLILSEDAYYRGKHFPKNTFVYAVANIQG